MNSGLEEARQLKVPCCLDCLKVMFGLSNRRTRFLSKVSGWGVGTGKVKLLLRKKWFKCQFEVSKPLTDKMILGSNRSNAHDSQKSHCNDFSDYNDIIAPLDKLIMLHYSHKNHCNYNCNDFLTIMSLLHPWTS